MSSWADLRKFTLIFPLLLILSSQLFAQDSTAADSIIIPDPSPFSLDAESAIYCINLLQNNRFIEKNDESDRYKIIEVEMVWSWFLEFDESFPEGHRRRYDIIVNESPMDWDNSYIEVGGEMINLHLLFLYRNQHPPAGLDYYLEN